jgi:hypothetical protein
MATRDELILAIAERYCRATRAERAGILDEFVAVTGFHRKHAMRLLRGGRPGLQSGPRSRQRVYDEAVRDALTIVWEASDRVCGKRLRPLLPALVDAMERHGHLQLAPEVRTSLMAMSAATMDRALQKVDGGRREAEGAAGRLRRRFGAASRCGPFPTGRIRHQDSSRRIWLRTAVPWLAAASYRRWS